jgi:hypothetical protein
MDKPPKFNMDKPPFLNSVETQDVTKYIAEHEEHTRYVQAYNSKKNVTKKLPEISFLGQISFAIKDQILDELLPSTIPVLQEFYPVSRIFWDAPKPLTEVTLQAGQKASSLVRSLIDDLVGFLRSELESETVSRLENADDEEPASDTEAARSEPSLDQDTPIPFPPPTNFDANILQNHIDILLKSDPQSLVRNPDSVLHIHAGNYFPEIFWNEDRKV